MSLYCPLCSSHMDSHTDPGDPECGYSGGEERFRCSSDKCELGQRWCYADDVEDAVAAYEKAHQGDAA